MLWGILQDMGVGLRRAFFLLDLEPGVRDRPDAVAMPATNPPCGKRHVAFRPVHVAPGAAIPAGVG